MEKKQNEETEKKDKQKSQIERRSAYIIIFLIALMILLFYIINLRLGKIGYLTTSADIPVIEVTDDEQTIGKETQLNIFNNSKYNWQKLIAPHSNEKYEFCIKNPTNQNLNCNLDFRDEMTNYVNMKYKLKMNNEYIKGNDSEYVSVEDLSIEKLTVTANSSYIFELEWYWADDDIKDTFVGSKTTDQYYKLFLEVNRVQEINKGREF